MKRTFLLTLVFVLANLAHAEVKRSSRNLVPLSKRTDEDTQSSKNAASQNSQPAKGEDVPGMVSKFTFVGSKTGWGLVKTSAYYYSPQGKNLGTLPGGTLFTYTDVKDSSKNTVLVSTVKRNEKWDGPYLLDCTDIVSFEGTLDKVSPTLLKDLTDYFTIKGKIAERKAALSEDVAASNPYYKTAKQSMQVYQDSIAKAAEMEKQMSTLSGARKIKADEALRALKYEQVRIKTKADQATAAYKAWKDAHPADFSKIETDPQLRDLEKEFQAVATKVVKLIPPES